MAVRVDGGLAGEGCAAGDQDLVGLTNGDGRQDVEGGAGFFVRLLERCFNVHFVGGELLEGGGGAVV